MTVAFMTWWSYLTRRQVGLLDIVTLAGVVVTVVTWGEVLWGRTRLGRLAPNSFPLHFLLGLTLVGTTVSLGRFFVGVDIRLWFGLLLGLGLLLRPWDGRGSADPRADRWSTFLPLAAATAWLQHYFPPLVLHDGQWVIKPIRDQFIHAHQVLLLSHPGPMEELGRYGLAGEPVPFYHYASYVFPAILHAWTPQSAFETTVSLWLPLSLTVVGWGAYLLGQTWFGPRGGWAPLLGVLVLPDPSYWTFGVVPLGTYIYSFHRFLQLAAANAYAIAVGCLALSILTLAYRHRSVFGIGSALSVGGSILFFKAQIFLAAFPLLVLLAIASFPLGQPGRLARNRFSVGWWGLAGLLLASIAASLLLPSSHLWERTPRIAIEWPPGERLADFLLVRTIDDPPAARLAERSVDAVGIGSFSWRALLVLFLALRWWLLPAAFLLVTMRWHRPQRRLTFVPLLATGIYGSYALFLAPNLTGHAFGNPWDLQFVPFCWFYAVVVVWIVGSLEERLRGCRVPLPSPITCCVCGLFLPLLLGRADSDDWQTGERWAYFRISPGLLQCCEYIRTHAPPTDRMQDSTDDPNYVVEALAERRAYAGWPVVGSYTARDAGDALYRQRLAELEQWREESDPQVIRQFAKEQGIRWFLLHPQTTVSWPRSLLDRPSYESAGYRVYHFAPDQP
jgi:hypothetical protein